MGIFSRLFGSKDVYASGESKMVGLVVLLSEPIDLNESDLRQHLDSIFPGHFIPQTDDSFVTEGSNDFQVFVKSNVPSHSGAFLINFVPGSYTKFSDFANDISDPRWLDLVDRHDAWLSVDLVGEIESEDDAYRFVGKVLARLAPAGTLAIVHPGKHTIVPFTETGRGYLQSENVLQSLGMRRS